MSSVIRVGCATLSKSRIEAVVQSLFSYSVASLAYLFYMAFASDLDESSESEYKFNEFQLPESDHNEDEYDQLELEAS
jgi:hypothetical protein